MNAFISENNPESQPQMNPALQPQMNPAGNPQFQQLPQAQPQPQQNYQPSSEEIMKSHQQVDAVMDGLISLVSKPNGELTKKDVFDTASEMIAKGAFPTPEAKQQLIGGLANLPDDEAEIRKILGQHLLSTATFRNHLHNAFGAPQTDQFQAPSGAV